MNKLTTGLVAVGGLAVSGYFLASWLMEPAPATASPLSEEVTYMCRETGALFRGSRDEGPDATEAGDCQNLVQALYCPMCRKWYPFPPLEILERMPAGPVCPRHRTGLLEEIPEAATTGHREQSHERAAP